MHASASLGPIPLSLCSLSYLSCFPRSSFSCEYVPKREARRRPPRSWAVARIATGLLSLSRSLSFSASPSFGGLLLHSPSSNLGLYRHVRAGRFLSRFDMGYRSEGELEEPKKRAEIATYTLLRPLLSLPLYISLHRPSVAECIGNVEVCAARETNKGPTKDQQGPLS